MKKILHGPLTYFYKKSHIKGVLWLIIILAALYVNIISAIFIWLLAGWFGSRHITIEPIAIDTPNPVTELTTPKLEAESLPIPHSQEPSISKTAYVNFPEVDDKGMKLLKILDNVKLSGVTKECEGVNPQDIIEDLFIGEEVFFKRIPVKKFPNATLVVDNNNDPIGWIPESFFYQEDIAKRLDDGTTVRGMVSDILGGENGKSYGVLIDIARYEKKRATKTKKLAVE